MNRRTKIRLSDDKIFQLSGDTLSLSGITNIYKKLLITETGILNIHDENTAISKNVEGDLTFQDVNTGVVKLQDLLGAMGSVIYQGEWDANTNDPTLPDASGVTGHYYTVISAGTYNDIDFRERDWVISDGIKWDIVRNHAGIFFLTEEEYNELTEEEKNDTSKIYFIEDEFSASGITAVSNIGDGDGEIYKDVDNDTLRLRTIFGSGDTTVTTSGDTVIVYSESSGDVTPTGDSCSLAAYDASGNLSDSNIKYDKTSHCIVFDDGTTNTWHICGRCGDASAAAGAALHVCAGGNYEDGIHTAGNLILSAGDNNRETGGAGGCVFISPGVASSSGSIGNIILGKSSYIGTQIGLLTWGCAADVGLTISTKGNGSMSLQTGTSNINVTAGQVILGNALSLSSARRITFIGGDGCITGGLGTGGGDGRNLIIRSGQASSTGNGDGGNLILCGGEGQGTGSTGQIQMPSLSEKTAEICVLYIDGSGNISYGEVDAGGDFKMSGSTANGLTTYVDSTTICAQPNLTFDGNLLTTTGCICATTCFTSPSIEINQTNESPHANVPAHFEATNACEAVRIFGWSGATGESQGLRVFNQGGTTTGQPTAIVGNAYYADGPSSSGRSCGICGVAGNKTSRYNYGVIGRLCGTNDGAGIVGVAPDCGFTTVLPVGCWAGAFYGDTFLHGDICFCSNANKEIGFNTTSVTTGRVLTIRGNEGDATSVGGIVRVCGGVGGSTSGNGGDVCLRGGNATSNSGGNVCLRGGTTANGVGGGIRIYGGIGTIACGNVFLYNGNNLRFQTTSVGSCTHGVHAVSSCITSPIVCGTSCVESPMVCATCLCVSGSSAGYNIRSNRCGCAVDWVATSDCRKKKNIIPISNALSMVTCFCGVCYDFCENNAPDIGLIAQDVEKIEPRLVTTATPSPEEKDMFGIEDQVYGLKYDKFAGLFVEAIKELKAENEQLRKEINELKEKIK